MKSKTFLFGLLFSSFSVLASEGNGLKVSLLNCSTGPALHAAFGHTAIRIIDNKSNKDLVFDYGIFDWNTPNFLYQFLSGSLQYKLSVKNFDTFYTAYEREGRGITERAINLRADDEVKLYEALLDNRKKENRYYDYEFFTQNCATKLRDMLFDANGIFPPYPKTEMTYRHGLHECLRDKPWTKVGVDLILGPSVDKPLTHHESMFIPHLLDEQMQHYLSAISSDRTIVDWNQAVLLKEKPLEENSFFADPILVMTILIVVFGLLHQFRKRLANVMAYTVFILFGLIGVFLILLWTGSHHEPLSNNMNIIWANPFYLILPFLKRGAFRKYFVITLLIINTLFVGLATFNWLPQEINTVVCLAAGLGSGLLFSAWMEQRLPPTSSS
ncbi:DUF4105 domain-containing protein [bacterium AH-315-B15]|nr:DUF4105 domain-containing protein [bacterium AH-315-B15]